MNFTQAISVCFSKYATFSGRARRSEYWYFYLFTLIGSVLLAAIDTLFFEEIEIFGSLFSLAIALPTIAVTTRRLHDTNRSGWFQLLPFITIPFLIPGVLLMQTHEFVGMGLLFLGVFILLAASILLLVWFSSDGDQASNRFGPTPKGEQVESIFE